MSKKPTDNIEAFVATYETAIRAETKARDDLAVALVDLTLAQNELGRAIVPEDAPPGQDFNVWIGDPRVMLVARKVGKDEYRVRPWNSGTRPANGITPSRPDRVLPPRVAPVAVETV